MNVSNFTSRLALAASPLAIGLALVATPAAAQTAPAEEPTAADEAAAEPITEAEGEAIVVTGFRRALESAINTKKRQEQVVEAVSAEDIGKLPDNGIGESIARLPGLSAQRAQGRANIISIRGFGPDFSVTTLNGREQTTTNDSRAVEFDQFPSEILNQVVVYKTSAANLISQGLVGTIDLRTIRPLDAKRRVLAVGARGTYTDEKLNPDTSDMGYRFYGTFVDQFADDRIGVALSASYTDEPYHSREWAAWGYESPASNPGQLIFTGSKTYNNSSQLKRFGLNGTLQAKVNDTITATVDAFYSNFKDRFDSRWFEFPAFPDWGNSTLTNAQSEGGLITSGTLNGVYGIARNDTNDREADLYSIGGNLAWNNGNGWKAFLDVAWSRTDRVDQNLQATAGTGYARSGASTNIGFTMGPKGPTFTNSLDYSNPAQIFLTDTQGWGGAIIQAGYDNVRDTRDDLAQYKAEIEREFDGFIDSVKVGAGYTDRSKELSAVEAYLVPAGGALQIAVPSNLLLDPTVVGRGIGPILTFDPRKLVDANILSRVPNSFGQDKGYSITEKLFQPYIMATFSQDVGAAEVTGNVGFQAVRAEQSSTGDTFPGGVRTRVTAKTSYWDYLPSLNVSARLPNDIVVRGASSIQIMRPRMPDLNTVINYGTDTTLGIISGSGGNPYLKPHKALAFDLNIEKYFGSKGYVAIQLFHKKMLRYIAGGTTEFDYSQFPAPAVTPVNGTIGLLSAQVNTKGGYIRGLELAGTLPFDVLTPALDGFGLTGGYGYTETRIRNFNNEIDVIPGYSKHVASLTAFFEKAGFSLRGSMRYRSAFRGDFRAFNGELAREDVQAETVYDAQVGYDFQKGTMLEGLSLYLQGQNLTDEASRTLPANAVSDDQYLRYATYGRRFLAGFTYKFR
ncbi:TonB-dependent receptor [Sphingomonas sp. LHG3406-1]|uniref:TonB-dependent receptor n=1 Tax=Sphingomonas sp. LHG3406-1 TaxID=2804617 RepID=UPI00262FE460|nr:TonB-dependent receptor [Sphingomonas sp. LHG3406-1]